MEFIISYWWLWLAVMIISGVYAFNNQLKRDNRIKKEIKKYKPANAIYQRVASLMADQEVDHDALMRAKKSRS